MALLSTSSGPPKLFDLKTKAKQKARAALSADADKYEYLRDHMAASLVDRLDDIPRNFTHGLDLFCGNAHVLRAFQQAQHNQQKVNNHAQPPSPSPSEAKDFDSASTSLKVARLSHVDIHPLILSCAHEHFSGNASSASTTDRSSSPPIISASVEDAHVYLPDEGNDESQPFPLGPHSVDVVLSAGGLHWVNDLPALLRQIRHTLRPDGVFIGAMLGGETLHELRISMQLAEDELKQRVAPRVSPMIHLRDVASLLSAAGFKLPTADYERIVMSFPSMNELLKHLRGMGETNALIKRPPHYGRAAFERAAQIYSERFPAASDTRNIDRIEVSNDVSNDAVNIKADDNDSGRIEATFDIMYMIGWAPGPTQPSPRERGSASVSLADIANLTSPSSPGRI